MSEFVPHRRGFGGNTRLDPLVGKSPSLAGVPHKPSKSQNLMSQSLLKGNRLGSNNIKMKEKDSKVKIPVIDEKITIKVTDERKNINKNFECK